MAEETKQDVSAAPNPAPETKSEATQASVASTVEVKDEKAAAPTTTQQPITTNISNQSTPAPAASPTQQSTKTGWKRDNRPRTGTKTLFSAVPLGGLAQARENQMGINAARMAKLNPNNPYYRAVAEKFINSASTEAIRSRRQELLEQEFKSVQPFSAGDRDSNAGSVGKNKASGKEGMALWRQKKRYYENLASRDNDKITYLSALQTKLQDNSGSVFDAPAASSATSGKKKEDDPYKAFISSSVESWASASKYEKEIEQDGIKYKTGPNNFSSFSTAPTYVNYKNMLSEYKQRSAALDNGYVTQSITYDNEGTALVSFKAKDGRNVGSFTLDKNSYIKDRYGKITLSDNVVNSTSVGK